MLSIINITIGVHEFTDGAEAIHIEFALEDDASGGQKVTCAVQLIIFETTTVAIVVCKDHLAVETLVCLPHALID